MITTNELKKAQTEIHNKIESFAKENGLSNDSIEPIYDGVCDIEKYLESYPRIMWVLKEYVDELVDGKPSGGDYKVYEAFKSDTAWKNRTWQPMIYTSYGIAHRRKWNEMDWIRDDKTMVDILYQVAYINISKMPGCARSNDADLRKYYNEWRPIIREQIETYNPQVIIFGNTFKYMKQDLIGLGVTPNEKKGEYLDVYRIDNKLYFDAYHPSVWKNDCCKTVIDICLDTFS